MKDTAPDTRPAALLLDEERKRMLANLDPLVINAYAAEYSEAFEFEDAETLRYLDENLVLSMSKKGFRSIQIVDMSNAREAARLAAERMSSPTYNIDLQGNHKDRQPPKKTVVNLFGKP